MVAEGDNITTYIYRGGRGEVIPLDATHITVDKSVTVIRARAFYDNPHIVEAIFHIDVERVGKEAFLNCTSLRRVIMPGVEVVEGDAFRCCVNLIDVECGKLEIIKGCAFDNCRSLSSIDLPSGKIVQRWAFSNCPALTDVNFGSKLERIQRTAFYDLSFDDCIPGLERITIPLKDGLIAWESFIGCYNLKHVDLVEGAVHETIAALQLEEWRNDMNEEIDSINQILPTAPGEGWNEGRYCQDGENIRAIRTWIRSVLRKIIHYKTEHQRLLDEEAATALQLVLPQDIVMNNVLPFLELPSYTFEVGEHEEAEEEEEYDSDDEDL
eukprot:scaffold16330_cov88-Skeletonema_dohrnii-CCMP3373.AAC.3